jgi:hypothetical protein
MLRPHADLTVEIRNDHNGAHEVELVDPDMDWHKFQHYWDHP